MCAFYTYSDKVRSAPLPAKYLASGLITQNETVPSKAHMATEDIWAHHTECNMSHTRARKQSQLKAPSSTKPPSYKRED